MVVKIIENTFCAADEAKPSFVFCSVNLEEWFAKVVTIVGLWD